MADSKTDEMLAVEAEHGFVFGDTEDRGANAPATLSVLCTNLMCERRGQHVQLHADTAIPVHCGGCGTVIYCDHPSTSLVTHHEGTLRTPVRVLRTVCDTCGGTINTAKTDLRPIPVDEIPLHLLGGVNLDTILGS